MRYFPVLAAYPVRPGELLNAALGAKKGRRAGRLLCSRNWLYLTGDGRFVPRWTRVLGILGAIWVLVYYLPALYNPYSWSVFLKGEIMKESTLSLEPELRVSPKLAAATLMVLGVALVFVGEAQIGSVERTRMFVFSLLFYATATVAWLLDLKQSWVGRWFVVVALFVMVNLGYSWFGAWEFLTLIIIPVALAGAAISWAAAFAVAVGETVWLVLRPPLVVWSLGQNTLVIPLIAVWVMAIMMYAVYRSINMRNQWMWDYFERTRDQLEEARERRMELEQVLEDLGHANRQLALSAERMTALRLIAQGAQEAKSRFVARVSHEFRAPLNMIIGLVGIMVENPETYAEEFPPDLGRDLQIVYRNCEHLSSMIDDVLDLSQVEAGGVILRREQVDLAEVIDSAAAIVRPLIEKKRLALRVAIQDGLPEVHCDRTRIRQVVLNLISNAARFTTRGAITVRAEERGQYVVVCVSDTGPGISSEDASRIFEPFYQATSSLSAEVKGTGLGLSISKQFIDLHDGRIWLESEVGVGSSFFFELPISAPAKPVARPARRIREDWEWREQAFKTSRTVSAEELVKPCVVICDESGDLYPRLSSHAGEVEFVDTRDLANAIRQIQQCPANVLVLNTVSPGDLLPLVEAVRQEIPETPIIGCSVPRTVDRAVKAGVLGRLVKPVMRADLEEALRAAGPSVRRVLVVDDDPQVVTLLARLLRLCDPTIEVVTALGGEKALEELANQPPDLMLLDIVMPGMDGWRVLELVKQDERMRDVPVFLVSAQDTVDQFPLSRYLVVAMGDGISIGQLLRCSLDISTLLWKPVQESDRALV